MPPLPDSTTVGISVVIAVTGLAVASRWRGSQSSPYPPGPPPDPIIGNARAMTSDELERVFAAWGEKYGALPPGAQLRSLAKCCQYKVTSIM